MSSIAFCLGRTIIYWDAVIIALAVLACFAAVLACYTANGGRVLTLCALMPLMLLLALLLSRLMYWYCHQEQFGGLSAALTVYSSGSFCLAGIPLGFVLAVLLARLTGLERRSGLLLDCLAPGLALGLAVLRLSAAFNGSCRGKALITEPALQRLPFAFPNLTGTGALEYRFAAFFVEALLFALFALILTAVFCRRYGGGDQNGRTPTGDCFLLFLLLYSAAELLIDSARNDASYFLFNAFVSVAQILSAVAILALLIHYTRLAAAGGHEAKNGLWPLWALYLLSLADVGLCEYMVQRHGNRQLLCYSLMTLGCLLMVLSVLLTARRACHGAYRNRH